VDATLTVNQADLLEALLTGSSIAAKVASGEAKIDGNPAALLTFTSLLTKPRAGFPIVTPR
jgi:alkyl sulfatase BDS1-like metallo-beta-lactamase superfamily hydrolase